MHEAVLSGPDHKHDIFYRVWKRRGDGGECATGGVVMIVHGYAEHGGRYAHVASRLVSELGVTVVASDHVGHGKSGGERALIEDFDFVVRDLHAVYSAAVFCESSHSGRLIMIGHSMGGLLTARFAETYPNLLAGVGFLGAVLGDWKWARQVLDLPAIPKEHSDPAGMSRNKKTQEQYASDPLVYRGFYKRQLLVAEVHALDQFNANIGKITMPVLFMHGAGDPFVPFRDSLDAATRMNSTDLTLRVFPGARHELINEIEPVRSQAIDHIVQFVRTHLSQ